MKPAGTRTLLVVSALLAAPGLAARQNAGGAPESSAAADSLEVVKVAVLDLPVVDNSYLGDADSLRSWMVASGIEPTTVLRDVIGRPETYAVVNPRARFVSVDGRRIAHAVEAGAAAGACGLACAVRVGKAVGADRVVTGEVTKLSMLIWFVTARVVDVRSGDVLRQDEFEVKGVIGDLMPKVMGVLARRFANV
jgi:hypothetical protein